MVSATEIPDGHTCVDTRRARGVHRRAKVRTPSENELCTRLTASLHDTRDIELVRCRPECEREGAAVLGGGRM